MLQTLPFVAREKCFALKGGTAINFFLRDMARLSVDIDLTYLPLEARDISLKNMGEALQRLSQAIQGKLPNVKVQVTPNPSLRTVINLLVKNRKTAIKIEVNPVIRGFVYPCETRDLSPKAEDLFNLSASIVSLSTPDLYGGKICAALDRQHPRDLFDIKLLMENEGLTPQIRKAFLVYLISHDRPMSELLSPIKKDIQTIYENEFEGMPHVPVTMKELTEARDWLIKTLMGDLTDDEKQFLLSMKEGAPDWGLLGIPGVDKLPAVQWKLLNIRKMDRKAHEVSMNKLRNVLHKI
ncbi:MAG: nucleotidyl transferase AbiEii/AbiGii toxin family protein [Deltaproteobacteria bacterium]|nr:nucleotidyl transferase AbiEii/AbiGii toxin family protein [Deltaproteobacteria bacterium]